MRGSSLTPGRRGDIVSLVAYHSGADREAEQRGLAEHLAKFEHPDAADLDLLTLIDMSTGPKGEHVDPADRLGEILSRYEPGSPVHRAVSQSRAELLAACARAKQALGLSDEWHVAQV